MGNLLKTWINSKHLPVFIIAIYFLISVIKIEHPGVNNDQLMFVNAATLNPENYFLWKSYHGIPLMIFPYIGALKSYIYMPIFYFFGINIWSIRLPHIIIISISFFLLYKTLLLSFNKTIAILAILFLSLDPSHIIYSKIDTGPTVLEFFLKVLTIYIFFLYTKTKKRWLFLLVYPVLLLGIFNKINFFWFVNAFIISFLVLYGKSFYNDFKSLGRFVPLILVVIPYYVLLRFFIKLSRETALSYKSFVNEVSLGNIFINFPIFYKNLTEVINGNLFFNIAYGYNPTNFGVLISMLFVCLLFFGSALILVKIFSRSSEKPIFLKPYIFFVLIMVGISLQILLTKKAISAWHFLAVYPFFTIILATSVLLLYSYARSWLVKKIIIILVAVIIAYQLIVNFIYLNKLSDPTKSVALSSTIYELINYAKVTKSKFICLDVDICNQLLSFNQERNKYFEPFAYLNPETYTDSFVKLVDNFNKPDDFLYVSYSDEKSHFPNLKKSFFEYLKDSNIDSIKIKQFKDQQGVIFEVYKVGFLSK